MRRVLIVQRVLPHYRVPFFNQLRQRLAFEDVELKLVVGQPTKVGASKRDEASLDWASKVTNVHLRVGREKQVVWQPILREARHADLVIVEQASRLLVNYLLLAQRPFGGPRVAFWGHGENLDRSSASRLGEAVKRRLAPRADWWFCYTQGTSRLLVKAGISPERMTVVQNATDVTAIQALLAKVSESDRRLLRTSFGIGDGPVALSLGSIYPSKRPHYLIKAADHLHQSRPDFHLIVIGDGPDRPLVDAASGTRPWLHPVGMLNGKSMVEHASLASLLLNPGLVGLAVVDAFALRLPTVTCDLELHSPEIEYLSDGINGCILPRDASPGEFAAAVERIWRDDQLLKRLRAGAVESAKQYSIESMVENFARGVLGALLSRRR